MKTWRGSRPMTEDELLWQVEDKLKNGDRLEWLL